MGNWFLFFWRLGLFSRVRAIFFLLGGVFFAFWGGVFALFGGDFAFWGVISRFLGCFCATRVCDYYFARSAIFWGLFFFFGAVSKT